MDGYGGCVLITRILDISVLHYAVFVCEGIAELNLNALALGIEILNTCEFFVRIRFVLFGDFYFGFGNFVYAERVVAERVGFLAGEHDVVICAEISAVPTADDIVFARVHKSVEVFGGILNVAGERDLQIVA